MINCDESVADVVWEDYNRIVKGCATQICPGCGNVNWDITYVERNTKHGVWAIKQSCKNCASMFTVNTSIGV